MKDRPAPPRPIRALEADGEIVEYPSVDALFAELERRAVARYGRPRCPHGFFFCRSCSTSTPARAETPRVNTWSDEREAQA